jgi:hypothetical protein
VLYVAVVVRGRHAESNRGGAPCAPSTPGNRAAPARDDRAEQARQGSNPDRRGWSSPCSRLHHGPTKQTTRIERASPEWQSGALPSELRLRRSLRQESNPHLGRTKGACLPLTLRRLEVETAGVEPAPPRCKRGALPQELHPQVMRTDGVEPPQREATRLQRAELTSAQRPREQGGRPGSNRYREVHDLGCSPLHHGHHERLRGIAAQPLRNGDDRTRTGGLSPDKRALCSSELRPRSRAGGIRSHDLELMRLARTAAPLPRIRVWPAGVEPAISGSRNRRGGHAPLRPVEHPRRDLNPQLPG